MLKSSVCTRFLLPPPLLFSHTIKLCLMLCVLSVSCFFVFRLDFDDGTQWGGSCLSVCLSGMVWYMVMPV
ncbi:hypothetical protein HOY80DRAFT_993973 [Tuber brumale]|nr:hypothetical protein HOY80DRAFT_993973 [Tuber brumale]